MKTILKSLALILVVGVIASATGDLNQSNKAKIKALENKVPANAQGTIKINGSEMIKMKTCPCPGKCCPQS